MKVILRPLFWRAEQISSFRKRNLPKFMIGSRWEIVFFSANRKKWPPLPKPGGRQREVCRSERHKILICGVPMFRANEISGSLCASDRFATMDSFSAGISNTCSWKQGNHLWKKRRKSLFWVFCISPDSVPRSFPMYLSVEKVVAKDLKIVWSGVLATSGASHFVCRAIRGDILRRQRTLRKCAEVSVWKSGTELSFLRL